MMRRRSFGFLGATFVALALASTFASREASAFPGVYAPTTPDAKPVNNATHVVVMREGKRTVMTIFPDYQGPVESFALILPVPATVTKEEIKTLNRMSMDRIELLAAPRLVEYWELDPCSPATAALGGSDAGSGTSVTRGFGGLQGPKVQAHFMPAEYDMFLLPAKDLASLTTWLHTNKLTLPPNAAESLKPFLDGSMKLLVAKIDAKRLQFLNGIAQYSAIRIWFDSDRLTIPMRIGLASSPGVQELTVSVLARHQRYEAANYPNVVAPTNVDVVDGAKTSTSLMYTSIFDATIARTPRAFVTEYAWDATSCDPCTTPGLTPDEFLTFGADVLPAAPGESTNPTFGSGFVLSRLHARYRPDEATEDLVLRAAEPIAGGREDRAPNGTLDHGSQPSTVNAFEERYAVRHVWSTPIKCDHPVRGVWGGLAQGQRAPTMGAVRLPYTQRAGLKLSTFLREDVPEIGFVFAPPDSGAPPVGASDAGNVGTTTAPKRAGCSGCSVGSGENGAALAIAIPIVALGVRRRRRDR